MKQVIPYYVRGHTADGMVNFIKSNIKEIENIYVLDHSSHQVISNVLVMILNQANERTAYEKIYSPYLVNGLEGIIYREESYAILSVDVLDNTNHKSYTTIDLTKWIPYSGKKGEEDQVISLLKHAYEQISKALHIHDDLEQVYIDEMDFAKADKITEVLLQQIFHNVPRQKKSAHIYKRLFGTNTIGGTINKVEELIAPINKRIYVKGRAGTGKSVLLKKVIKKSLAYGYDVEVYRCSFDPKSVDMVIIRELDYCLFDSTAPHEFFPTHSSDQVIDLYLETVTPGTDEKYESLIRNITTAYKDEMKKGLLSIMKLKEYPMFNTVTNHLMTQQYDIILQEIKNEIKNKLN